MQLYIKYPIDNNIIFELLKSSNYKTITFFIDLQSISKGLFSKKTIELEISKFDEEHKLYTLPYELFEYVKKLSKIFIKYDPYFVIFYDSGKSLFHSSIDKDYKSNRAIVFEDSIYFDLYKKIKDFYFSVIHEVFNKYDNVSAVFLDKIESDFVPYYVILNNLADTKVETNLNIILSTDKDLLQVLEFNNTFQYVVTFSSGYKKAVYNRKNAVKYIYRNFKTGLITAEYIPLILSIAGDKSDNIEGLKGFGVKKAIDLILKYDLYPDLSNIDRLIDNLDKNDIEKIKKNYKLISFKYLVEHLGPEIKEKINSYF